MRFYGGVWLMVGSLILGLAGCVFSVDGEGYVPGLDDAGEMDGGDEDIEDLQDGSEDDVADVDVEAPQVWWTSEWPEEVYFVEGQQVVVSADFECAPQGCETECESDGSWQSCVSGAEVVFDSAGTTEFSVRAKIGEVVGEPISQTVDVIEGIFPEVQGVPESGETPFRYFNDAELSCKNLSCEVQCVMEFDPQGCQSTACIETMELDCGDEPFTLQAPGPGELRFDVEACVGEVCETIDFVWEVIEPQWTGLSVRKSTGCGIVGGDALVCWGENLNGMLGVGDEEDRAQPTMVLGRWAEVAVGSGGVCAIDVDGAMWCWGDGRLVPEVDEVSVLRPELVNSSRWAKVAVGEGFGCGITESSSELYCWGEGYEDAPITIDAPEEGWEEVFAYEGGACGINGGDGWCWGEFADISNPPSDPKKIGGDDWSSLRLGSDRLCGIHGSALYCHEEGMPHESVENLSTLEIMRTSAGAFALGETHACLIDGGNDQAYCWGSNNYGELGQGDWLDRDDPTSIPGNYWQNIEVGDAFSCAINTADELLCWGRKEYLGVPPGADDENEPQVVEWPY